MVESGKKRTKIGPKISNICGPYNVLNPKTLLPLVENRDYDGRDCQMHWS